MKRTAMVRWVVLPGVLAGFVLHAFTCFFMADGGPSGFTVGLFAISILPYLGCLGVGVRSTRGEFMAACTLPFLLFLDISAFSEAFIYPTTSTSPLVLLVVPVINLAVMVLGFLIGWAAFAILRRRTSGETL